MGEQEAPRARRPRGGPLGLSPAKAAKELGISIKLFRQAITDGDVKTVSFGGTFIPHSEITRIRKLFEQGTQE